MPIKRIFLGMHMHFKCESSSEMTCHLWLIVTGMQSFHDNCNFHISCKKILADITTGVIHPNGSKMLEMTGSILYFLC